jgi:hypothetical protein
MRKQSYKTRLQLATAFFVFAVHAMAENPFVGCENIPGDMSSCSPIVACMPADGVYFNGRALGWDRGALAGTTNTGVSCTGQWVSRNMFGLGQADFTCDDGLSGQVIFYYQDGEFGTTTGSGLTNALSRIRSWSGSNIEAFLTENGQLDGTLMCGEVPMYLS